MAAHAAGGAALGRGTRVNGVTLTAPGSVPGQCGRGAGGRDDDRARRSGRRRRRTRPSAPAPSLMPAMPPPARPCGRTPAAAKCSSWASLVTKHELLLAGHQLDGADDLVAVAEADDLPLVAAEHLRVDPLDDALAGAEREARDRRSGSEVSASARSPASSGSISLSGTPPARWGSLAESGQRRAGRARPTLSSRPAAGEHADLAARRGAHGAGDDVVVGAALAVAGRGAGRRAGEQAGGRQQREARVVGDLERTWPR